MLFPNEIIKTYAERNNVKISDDVYDILSTELEYQLRELIQEANKLRLFSMKRKLTVSHINNALKANNCQPIFGYSENSTFLNFKPSRRGEGNTFYIPDDEINLEDLLATNRKLLKESKVDNLVLNSHWLVIDNIQPDLPENLDLQKQEKSKLDDYQAESQIKSNLKHVLSTELKLYFDKIIDMLEYFSKESDFSNNLKLNDLLEKIKNEVGIQQLVPYFVQIYNDKLVQNPESSIIVLLFYKALINNECIFIDSYLHEIIPTMLTIIISRVYSNNNKAREIVNDILKHIFNKYANLYKNLGPRIINSLIKNIKNIEKNVDNLSAINSICFICPEYKYILNKILKEDNLSSEIRNYILKKIQ